MIDSNQILVDFIGANWMALIIIYGIFRAMFPNSKILGAIGESLSNLFPIFRKKDDSRPENDTAHPR